MIGRDLLLRVLAVPPRPEPPPGSPPRVFRAAPNFFLLRLVEWFGSRLLAVAGVVVALWFVEEHVRGSAPSALTWLLHAGELVALAALVLQVLFGWIVVRLDYEMRWYMLSDRAIRIREGVVSVKEKTIALANIQNISLREGPLQRLLGIADVEVKTAGGGQTASRDEQHSREEPMHIASFRGVANAAQIRDLLREGVRRQKSTGLGDPDEHAHEPHAPAVGRGVHEAALDLLAEARALRASITSGREPRPLNTERPEHSR